MVEFIRGALRGIIKVAIFIILSGLFASFIADTFFGRENFVSASLCIWVVTVLLLFAFPEIWKWLKTPV